MKYSPLGRSDLKVSTICLGTMTWGEQNTEKEAYEQLDYALDAGINFIDTAELYPVLPKPDTQGRTESYIGTWLAARGNRDKVILASKVTGRSSMTWFRGSETRLDKKQMTAALEASLKRLQTDYLDLYQLHWPDRKANYFGQLGYNHDPDDESIALEDQLEVLDGMVRSGKVRHVGVSNETAWGTARFLTLSQERGWPRMVTIQNPYSLLNRSFEVGLAEIAIREQCGLLAYSPLGFGVLSGKYLDGDLPPGARLTLFGDIFTRYTNDRAVAATRAYVEIARDNGLDPAQMALAYVNSRPFVNSSIVGATSLTQLTADIASIDVTLSEQVLKAIEAVHVQNPDPSP
jgi:aryl-alcohol dehydrogenase-like predicted oxidoreductase